MRALEQLQLARRAVPFDHLTHSNLAAALREAGRLDEALASYREALRIAPDHADALCGLGVTLGRLGRLEEAMGYLREVLRRQPNHAEAHAVLGGILMSRGQADRAIEHFEKALREKPGLAEVHNDLEAPAGSFAAELWDFLKHNKKWWLTPIIVLLVLLGILIVLGGTGAAPFIYTLF
ncbi:MAG: DUF5989 family protein [Planctomycetota bacterium]|nr:DUF5989 family protein [Planctomycetota bacterium]